MTAVLIFYAMNRGLRDTDRFPEAFVIRRVWLIVLTTIAGILVLLLIGFFGFIDSTDSKYFHFNSPGNSATLIVEENTWLFSGWSDFYVKDNMIFMKKSMQKYLPTMATDRSQTRTIY